MNIFFLSFYYHPDLCAGSFRAKAIVDELRGVLNDDDRLYIFTTLPNRYSSYTPAADSYQVEDNVTIYRYPVRKHKSGFVDQSLTFIGFANNVVETIKKDIDCSPDVVFATTSRTMTGVLGSYISRKYNSKFYLDIRDIFSETISELFGRKNWFLGRFVEGLFNRLEEYMVKRANRINLVSEGFSDYYINKGVNRSKLSFLPNGVDLEFINTNKERFARKDKIKITYAGNVGEGQGLENILPKVAIRLKDTHEIFIIGDGGKRRSLQLKIESKGIANIKLLNPVSRRELIRHYQDSDILFFHLNNYDAFRRVLPSKIFEYTVMGIPIVAGVFGYSSSFISKYVPHALIFTPNDEDSCINAIEKALTLNVSVLDIEKFLSMYKRDIISRIIAKDIYSLGLSNKK